MLAFCDCPFYMLVFCKECVLFLTLILGSIFSVCVVFAVIVLHLIHDLLSLPISTIESGVS